MSSEAEVRSIDGGLRAEIARLTAQQRDAPDPAIEERLVRLRHEGFASIDRRPTTVPGVSAVRSSDLGPDPTEIGPAELRADVIRDAFARHGCLVVRGLLGPDEAASLAGDVDTALEAFDRGIAGAPAEETSPWFRRFRPSSDRHRLGSRQFMRASGGMWTVDSPRMLFGMCELLDSTGVGRVATEYLGERPALSALKCNLRRVPVDTNSNWHQDGAFLGTAVRSLNLWLALSDCGEDAPGLDIVPRRLDDVVTTGTDGALFDWSVAPDVVDDARGDVAVVRPRFRAGDALLFDHLLLHRTGVTPTMTSERHAVECWMFAPSCYPEDQIPVVY